MGIETPVEGIVIPSSPADRDKIKKSLQEISDSMTRIEGEQDFIKDAILVVAEEHNIPKAFVKKLATTFHRRSFEKQMSEAEAFELAYKNIVGSQDSVEAYDELED